MNCAATSAVGLPSVQVRCIPSSRVSGRMTAFAIKAWRSARRLGGCLFIAQKTRSFQRLPVNIVERRNAIVPLEQYRGSPHTRDGARVKSPNRIEHWVIMGIQNIFLELRMACEVDLRHAIGWHSIDIGLRI